MAPSKLRKAIGAVKDRTSIGLVKVAGSNFFADLDVAILKATRHEEYPPDERYIREIISITLCSRSHVSSCINSISKRLNKTKNWTVALKTLMLVQRLLSEGDRSYENEMFYATRRGTRLLNMSDFRDHTNSGSWDYSAYVRTYALYLDEQLEFHMHNRRRKNGSLGGDEDEEDQILARKKSPPIPTTPVRELTTDHIFTRAQHLQQLLERFLACRPTGPAKVNRVVLASLYPIVKESFKIYYGITEIMNILIERFMELEVRDCMKVHEIFIRMSKQLDKLDEFHQWCNTSGVARSSEYPDIEKIEQKKIDLMDEFIKDKMVLAQGKRAKSREVKKEAKPSDEKVPKDIEEIHESAPPPANEKVPKDIEEIHESAPPPANEKKEEIKQRKETGDKQETSSSNLSNAGNSPVKNDEARDTLALALIDIGTSKKTATPEWVAFDSPNWKSSQTVLSKQNSSPGGGLDKLMLDGMYNQFTKAVTLREAWGGNGNASSLATGSNGTHQVMLALPAPPNTGSGSPSTCGYGDPFSASLSVAPPAYVQMSEIDMKQKMLVEEQIMWEHYARDGMPGRLGIQRHSYGKGGYQRTY